MGRTVVLFSPKARTPLTRDEQVQQRVCHHLNAMERLLEARILSVVIVEHVEPADRNDGLLDHGSVRTADGSVADLGFMFPAGMTVSETAEALRLVGLYAWNASKSL